jgi:hypothetical protein
MTNNKLLFLTVARQTADASDYIFVGRTEPFITALRSRGMSEEMILETYRTLKQSGYIRPVRDFDIDVFTITPTGLKWFLIRQYGDAQYRKTVAMSRAPYQSA